MESAVERYNRILKDHNLFAQLGYMTSRPLQDGAVLIERPGLQIGFLDEEKERSTHEQVREKAKGKNGE